MVEENYRLLALRDEKGAYLFTAEARAFAAAEKRFAEKMLPGILAADRVCLVANFDTLPTSEIPPFSRARMIHDLRRMTGKDTTIIRLADH